MSKFLPSLSILKKIEGEPSFISPFSTYYKEAPSAKLKILNQTLSPRRKYSPRWCKETNSLSKKTTPISVAPLNIKKSVKQFILTSKLRSNEASPRKLVHKIEDNQNILLRQLNLRNEQLKRKTTAIPKLLQFSDL